MGFGVLREPLGVKAHPDDGRAAHQWGPSQSGLGEAATKLSIRLGAAYATPRPDPTVLLDAPRDLPATG